MKITLIVFTFFFSLTTGFSQSTFFKWIDYEDAATITGVYPTDSGYYISMNYIEDLSNLSNIVKRYGYGRVSLSGELESFSPNVTGYTSEQHMSNRSSLNLNHKGHLMNCYFYHPNDTVNNLNTGVAVITEWSVTQGLMNSFEIDLRAEGIRLKGYSNLITSNLDKTYYCLYGYEDQNNEGTILIKLDEYGTIIWKKIISNSSIINVVPRSFVKSSDTSFMVGVSKLNWDQSEHSNSSGFGQFFSVDLNGLVIDSWNFNGSEYLDIGNALLPLDSNRQIFSYMSSINEVIDPNYSDDFYHMNKLVMVNEEHEEVWEINQNEKYSKNRSSVFSAKKVIQNDDDIIGAYQWYDYWYENPEDVFSFQSMSGIRIVSLDIDSGTPNWHRTYNLWNFLEGDEREVDSSDNINSESYIYDIKKTLDDGYIVAGHAYNYDSTSTGHVDYFAYLLKVNCYGFLGSPEAGLEYSYGDDLVVNFHNISTQAGRFTWIFGDGTTQITGEDGLNLSHTYPTLDTYHGMLIAHGCNGVADTLHFEVKPVKHLDPSLVTEGNGYFSIFPNPVLNGNQVFIYIAQLEENTELVISDNLGKLVDRIKISASESVYLKLPGLASGEYYLSLFVKGEKKKTHKLIVTN